MVKQRRTPLEAGLAEASGVTGIASEDLKVLLDLGEKLDEDCRAASARFSDLAQTVGLPAKAVVLQMMIVFISILCKIERGGVPRKVIDTALEKTRSYLKVRTAGTE